MNSTRISTGVAGLDRRLGGGLLPGTLTVVVGATGIGKSQLGVQFAHAGLAQEGRRGIFFDMTTRGDPQSQRDYARRIGQWELASVDADQLPELAGFFDPARRHGDYLNVFGYQGRRVSRRDLGFEAWQLWQAEIARKLSIAIAFFYGNFIHGTRRAVIDGVEPVERAVDSIQLELFEYVYHQIVRKEADWVARDLFREHFRQHEVDVLAHTYDAARNNCLLLYTSAESMLDDLISRPLDEGDLLAGANTVIYMGKVREGSRVGRALYIAKHRGSACDEEIIPYTIDDQGLHVEAPAVD